MIKDFIYQPYPLLENRWRIIISVSLFIASFMVIFQPFGLSGYNNELRPYFEIGYGFVTFLVLIIDLYVFPFFLDEWLVSKKWTVFYLSLCNW